MRILFVFTNIGTFIPYAYSFAIGLLSAILKKHNHKVYVFSVNNSKDIHKLATILKTYNPDVAAFTGISSQFLYIAQMTRLVKQWKNIPVICGGTHATLFPDDFINLESVDGIVVGEGEEAFLEYLEALQYGRNYFNILNFWFRQGGKIIKNESRDFVQNLDSLPYVDREISDHQKLINLTNFTIFMLAGRGCPSNCTFCSVPYLKEKGKGEFVRLRSVGNVLGEIKLVSQRYNFKHIYFRDDTFTWNKEWATEFCENYPKFFKYPFDILTRADRLDIEMMDNLKKAGCNCIWIGLESGNPDIRNNVLKKEITNEKILETCSYLQSIGIKPLMTNMVGLPFETRENFQETVELNKQIHSSEIVVSLASGTGPKIFVFSPFPGTGLYSLCKKEGWLYPMKYGFKAYQESVIDMPNFSRKEVYSLRRKFRYLVYKDNHPFKAFMFRIYDSILGQALIKLVPKTMFGLVTEFVSKIKSSVKE